MTNDTHITAGRGNTLMGYSAGKGVFPADQCFPEGYRDKLKRAVSRPFRVVARMGTIPVAKQGCFPSPANTNPLLTGSIRRHNDGIKVEEVQ